MSKNKSRIKFCCMGAVFAVLMVLCSWVSFPVPPSMTVTLQTFAAALCGYTLGAAWGSAALAVYILIGAAGVPVFSGFLGGVGVLVGPTGGFLYGFFALMLTCGLSLKTKNTALRVLFGCIGLLLCHLCGALHFSAVTSTALWASVLAVSVPYIIKDVLSVVLAAWVANKIKTRML